MLCIADSDAVASSWRRCVSETETETEWSFKFFERGKKSHFTENWLATGILESGKEMQYCMSWPACLSTAYSVFVVSHGYSLVGEESLPLGWIVADDRPISRDDYKFGQVGRLCNCL